MESAVFGGGCFWCVEAVFAQLKGVAGITSGYAGGTKPNPTYQEVCGGASGYAEVIKMEFDPSIIPFRVLLEVYFSAHDPTTLNQQGNDRGEQYRSVIFYQNETQKQNAEAFIDELTREKVFDRPIVTAVEPLTNFYPAEQHHQNYYAENQDQPYCQVVISPKVAKIRKKYQSYLK